MSRDWIDSLGIAFAFAVFFSFIYGFSWFIDWFFYGIPWPDFH